MTKADYAKHILQRLILEIKLRKSRSYWGPGCAVPPRSQPERDPSASDLTDAVPLSAALDPRRCEFRFADRMVRCDSGTQELGTGAQSRRVQAFWRPRWPSLKRDP